MDRLQDWGIETILYKNIELYAESLTTHKSLSSEINTMSILRYQTKMIEGPFGSENEYYYTMVLGDVEDFETNLVCSNPSCDWKGLPSEAEAQTVENGDFQGWKRLLCPRQGCGRGLKAQSNETKHQEY